ncbi:MAG: 30S ribosomal protein S13 [Bacilli bacterium]|nr:30S ribosomal protein S13 [Bacilli bacterium]
MARILGVDVQDKKAVFISLTRIYGIGQSLAKKICKKTEIDINRKMQDLTDAELNSLRNEIVKFTIEGDLRQQISKNISILKEINCYRGIRHKKHLPVHGQRTKSNARTRKGPRKTMANKKKATQKT